MEPKFKVGDSVMVRKEVYFMFHDFTIRRGEVGHVIEVDMHLINVFGECVYDYIVLMRGVPLFFYEDEIEKYP